MVLCRLGVFFVLTFVLLTQSVWGQRIGPLDPTDRQQSKALSTERTAAPRPPSLQLSLPSPVAVALPPLGPNDLQRLQPQEGRPPLIGVHRRLPAGAVKTTAEGTWQPTAVGRLWRLKMTSPSARAMRIHFRDFAIGAGSLWLHSASGQVVGPYTGSGLYGDGDFWSGIVFGDSLTIEYLPDGPSTKEAVPFQIVAISHIWDDAFGGDVEGGVRWPQGALGSSDRRRSLKPLPDRIDVAVGTQLKKSRLTKAIQLVERSASLQPPRPKAARPLTPGRPVSFSRGPVDTPTLFRGDFSFRLEVPEDASRVTFTLESDVDVELAVRYGEDNAGEDRSLVTDHRSRNPPRRRHDLAERGCNCRLGTTEERSSRRPAAVLEPRGPDREVRVPPLASAKTVLRWYPGGNCILAQPDRDVAAAPEATLVLPPVPDSVLLLVLAVDSARLRCDHDVTPRSL